MAESDAAHLSFSPLGDRALLIECDAAPGPRTTACLRVLAESLAGQRLPGITDIVPGLRSLALHYDPEVWWNGSGAHAPYENLIARLQALLAPQAPQGGTGLGRVVEIPVTYGGEYGMDLHALARDRGLTVEEVIALHSAVEYTVLMLGFAPGFGYLGPLDERLSVPRRATPRTRVPQGSVAVADRYTAVYPMTSPGGWHLIGRTPIKLFDTQRDPPVRFAAGDRVRFVPVSAQEFTRVRDEWR
ncbi:MAG TPA: 5-oxoprolinase subunit PxpB [Burkholderiales bacterium]|nr:5-oxoprolinase subunit PxpB [Burkholderiales bacterium]